jgi:DNA-binding HxlR family transcriptional regulator
MRDGYGQFCPIAVACEVFAERWTPLILRELFAGSHRFNEIHRCIPLISRALLARRLKDLEAADVITSVESRYGRGREYQLTESGREFRESMEALGRWGQRWTVRVQPQNLDAGLLMWNMRRRIDRERLPPRRVVVHFAFRGVPSSYRGFRKFWLMLEPTEVELCVKDPGCDVDLVIDTELGAMAGVWLGDLSFAEAARSKAIRISGPAVLVKQFPTWLLLSHYASVPRPATV